MLRERKGTISITVDQEIYRKLKVIAVIEESSVSKIMYSFYKSKKPFIKGEIVGRNRSNMRTTLEVPTFEDKQELKLYCAENGISISAYLVYAFDTIYDIKSWGIKEYRRLDNTKVEGKLDNAKEFNEYRE